MRIEVDRGACLAYGNCVAAAPDVYDLPDAKVEILISEPVGEQAIAARKGAKRCPAQALVIVDDEQDRINEEKR
ncbi:MULTISPECIES: ferredoxin [unclassified Gordonia (in: high G+C Gram-positive bacteria)]|uniref:ferredoxin n=1 Tax=unclassified Gordonia (in: high G+C Gram-positive bacteria) TaxID=2657482 RepID=UPI0009AC5619|nr:MULTISPECIES: ferredoxin [unclassified Gordonia (in: high G+C Gram-positive bacteria)]MDF3282974.1 ferredoxin [Gordonia sp. N1V]OPX10763.1 hypothetical protein B1964_23210 [Gordonia sp. i37]